MNKTIYSVKEESIMKFHPSHTGMYGVRSAVSGQFVYGIQEPSKRKAMKALFERIGDDARKYRFDARPIRRCDFHMFKEGLIINRPDIGQEYVMTEAPPEAIELVEKGKQYAEEKARQRASKKKFYNTGVQSYKGIPLKLIFSTGYSRQKAKRYTLNGTNQNVWIPNKHLEADGTIKPGEDIDYVFRKSQRQLELAGLHQPIPGIKRRTYVEMPG